MNTTVEKFQQSGIIFNKSNQAVKCLTTSYSRFGIQAIAMKSRLTLRYHWREPGIADTVSAKSLTYTCQDSGVATRRFEVVGLDEICRDTFFFLFILHMACRAFDLLQQLVANCQHIEERQQQNVIDV